MKTYGSKNHRYGSQITVMTEYPKTLDVGVRVGKACGTVFLAPKEVAALIEQLQTWLDNYHTGGVT